MQSKVMHKTIKSKFFAIFFGLFFEKAWSELLGALQSLFILPFLDELWVPAEKYVWYLPSIVFCWTGIDRRGEQVILETVAKC